MLLFFVEYKVEVFCTLWGYFLHKAPKKGKSTLKRIWIIAVFSKTSEVIVMWRISKISFMITLGKQWFSFRSFFLCEIFWSFGDYDCIKIQFNSCVDFLSLQNICKWWQFFFFFFCMNHSFKLKQRHVLVKTNIVWCVQWNPFLQLNPYKKLSCLNCQVSLLERRVVKIFSKVC